jgi:hypothetical protein
VLGAIKDANNARVLPFALSSPLESSILMELLLIVGQVAKLAQVLKFVYNVPRGSGYQVVFVDHALQVANFVAQNQPVQLALLIFI